MHYLQDKLAKWDLNAETAPVFSENNKVYGAVIPLGTFPCSQINMNSVKVAETARKFQKCFLGREL